nr:MAG TPA: hypothetical protein [Caudoviricetes sp.]
MWGYLFPRTCYRHNVTSIISTNLDNMYHYNICINNLCVNFCI